jgi:predicted phage-related endonuclease
VRFTVHDADQRSDAWHALRAPRLTSSYAKCLFAAGKGKEENVGKRDLRMRLALARMTGRAQEEDGWQSDAMRRGVEQEGAARLAYEAATGQLVREAGFVALNDHMAGTSLDGYLGDFEGVVELKCPKSPTHVGYIKAPGIPSDYQHQIRHHLWVTGAKWCDFVSFDDRLPEHLQLVIYRVTREELDIPGYEKAAVAFLKEVDALIEELNALRPVVAA